MNNNEKKGHTYLSFQLDNNCYASDVQNIYQVVELQSITPIPGAPRYMKGIINLRGRTIPVVDLTIKLGISEVSRDLKGAVIVVNYFVEDKMITIGALADSVQDVFELDTDEIDPVSFNFDCSHIEGIGRRNDKFVVILNFTQIFSTDELLALETIESLN